MMLHVQKAREANNEEKIDDIILIRRKYNIAYAMTKSKINKKLNNLLDSKQTKHRDRKLDNKAKKNKQ